MGVLKDYDSGIPLLEDWLKTQFHLPKDIDKIILKRFIHSTRGDLEQSKKLLDLNYTIRTSYSHIFIKRDPSDQGSENVLKITDMLILPNVTPEGYKVLFYRLCDFDPDKYNFVDSIKMFFMFADIRFITPDPHGITEGEIPIFDMDGFSLRHLTKVVLSALRIYMKFTQEAHPIRLKEIHIINCPSFIDKVLTLIKPFIKSEVFKLIHFHLPDSTTLYKHVPKEMLPNEYGGNAGKIETIKSKWIEILKQNRDYLMNEKYWKVNESKRSLSKKKGNHEVEGNFRSLSID